MLHARSLHTNASSSSRTLSHGERPTMRDDIRTLEELFN
jgi:hypothetical protein